MIPNVVFGNRLLYANELRKMGADIELWRRRHHPRPNPLRGPRARRSTSARGAALVLAGLLSRRGARHQRCLHIHQGTRHRQHIRSLGARIIWWGGVSPLFANTSGSTSARPTSVTYVVRGSADEPSVVAYSMDDNRVVAVGSQARQMLGRTPASIV